METGREVRRCGVAWRGSSGSGGIDTGDPTFTCGG